MAATLGFVFYIESVLVLVFNVYSYYPKIVDDAFQDTVFGNLFSQFSISTTSALSLVLGLSYVWYAVFAAVYYLIELLFLRLGIYELHTYKSIYTLLGFAPLFILVKFWYRKLVLSSKRFLHNATLLLGTNAILSTIFTLPLKVFDIQKFAAYYYEDASKNHTVVNILYGLVITPLFILIFRLKVPWAYKTLLILILALLRYLLYRAGVIIVIPALFFPLTILEFAARYGLIAMLDGFLARKPADAAA
jgi:hypothetical protein